MVSKKNVKKGIPIVLTKLLDILYKCRDRISTRVRLTFYY